MSGNTIIYENGFLENTFQLKKIIEDYLSHLSSENSFLYQNSVGLLSHFLEYIKKCSQNSK